jgi:hypothetical protein
VGSGATSCIVLSFTTLGGFTTIGGGVYVVVYLRGGGITICVCCCPCVVGAVDPVILLYVLSVKLPPVPYNKSMFTAGGLVGITFAGSP